VSIPLLLAAREELLRISPDISCSLLSCDLATAEDLPVWFDGKARPGSVRLLTFFGLIPNFEPQAILPKLRALMCTGDQLLFGANLAPGSDYATGVRKVLPLYDNLLTKDWLLTFLLDAGVEANDGEISFAIEPHGKFLRITAEFCFNKTREIAVDGREFLFAAGNRIRLFFSYRYTPEMIRSLLADYAIQVTESWIADSGEEGVFLCRAVS
jgi:L-histidine Nalpha-methyltransferase